MRLGSHTKSDTFFEDNPVASTQRHKQAKVTVNGWVFTFMITMATWVGCQ